MSKKATFALLQFARCIPFTLLVVTVLEPSIWEPVWGIFQGTGDTLSNHADQLVRELNWRLMNGVM